MNDRPVLFSGHQPIVFHQGILAKLIAQHEGAKRTGAARVWIVADQDPVELGELHVPSGRGDELDQIKSRLLAPGSTPPGVPSASLPPMEPLDTDDERLSVLTEYLRGYTHEETLAKQFASATIQLGCDRLGIDAPRIVYASELFSSEILWELVYQRLCQDPRDAVVAYNAATERYPEARVRPLRIDADRIEMPLWGLRDGNTRVAIDSGNIDSFSQFNLAPRGLLMSLLVRAHLGELFIHGTGGWEYDKITQDWARDWLGIELAPMALTTATQRLDLGFDPEQIVDPARALWEAHHARHNPSAVGDHQAQQKKDMCLRHIEAMQEHNEDPSAMYFKMHGLLEEYREHHAQELAAFDVRVRVARSMKKQIELAADRTWAFVLFDDDQLAQLRQAVIDAMH